MKLQNDFSGGMDERTSPELLPESKFSLGINLDIRNGRASSRRGLSPAIDLRGISSLYRGSAVVSLEATHPFLAYDGLALSFHGNSGGQDVLLFTNLGNQADPSAKSAALITVRNNPDPETGTGETFSVGERHVLCKARQALYLFRLTARNDRFAPLVCRSLWGEAEFPDDVDTEVVSSSRRLASFETIPENTESGFVKDFPRAQAASYLYDRLWMGVDTTLYASDIFDPESILEANSWILDGGGSRIQSIRDAGGSNLFVFMDRSVQYLSNLDTVSEAGELSPSRQVVDRSHGACGPNAVAQCGNDWWYADQDGVWSLSLNDQDGWRVGDNPVSAPVNQTYRSRLDRSRSAMVSIAVCSSLVIVSFPDSAGGWSAIVFDLERRAWSGLWTFPVSLLCLQAANFGGGLRLVSPAGQPLTADTATAVPDMHSVAELLSGFYSDYSVSDSGEFSEAPIQARIVTRGYSIPFSRGRAIAAEARIRHRSPSFSLSIVPDGNDLRSVQAVSGKTWGISKNDLYGLEGWNGDPEKFSQPGNSDYSPVPIGSIVPGGPAIELDKCAEHTVRASAPCGSAGWFQMDLRNSQGSVEIADLSLIDIPQPYGRRA